MFSPGFGALSIILVLGNLRLDFEFKAKASCIARACQQKTKPATCVYVYYIHDITNYHRLLEVSRKPSRGYQVVWL